MEREWNLDERSDGKLYGADSLVKVGCQDCKGCSACCHDMGQSIVLDPYDIWMLTGGLNKTVEELLVDALELNVVDGLILPNLKMQEGTTACYFLNEKGRCDIHAYRPGICRLFPLGRLYEEKSFQYFLQIHECRAKNRTKVRIRQWLDIPAYQQYEAFITDWHYWLKHYQIQIKQGILQGECLRELNLQILKVFFLAPYKKECDFYQQYIQRMDEFKILND